MRDAGSAQWNVGSRSGVGANTVLLSTVIIIVAGVAGGSQADDRCAYFLALGWDVVGVNFSSRGERGERGEKQGRQVKRL